MRAIVQSFMDQHPHNPKMDGFSVKEVGIVSGRFSHSYLPIPVDQLKLITWTAQIYTLHSRIQDMDEKRSRHRGLTRPVPENTSFERTSPRKNAKQIQMLPPSTTASPNGLQRAGHGTASPLSSLGWTPTLMNSGGPYPLGSSPEEDHPQRLSVCLNLANRQQRFRGVQSS